MRILITGSEGFLGHRLQDRLSDLGHKVTGVDIVGDNPFDVRDSDALSRLVYRIEPHVIVHLAAHSQIGNGAAASVFPDNTAMAWSALCAGHHVDARIILAGSAAEYGPTPDGGLPFNEDSALIGGEPYASSKVASSLMARNFLKADANVVVLRFSNLYGPGQRPPKLVAHLVETLMANGTAALQGEGKPRRQYLYVDDACAAVEMAVESEERGYFNISAPLETSSLELAEMMGVKTTTLANGGGAMRVAIDSTRANVVLGWQSETPLTVGLDATIRHAMEGDLVENRYA